MCSGLVMHILLFLEKLKLLEPSEQKRKERQDSNVKEAKRSKRGKRGRKNEDTAEERAKAEIGKVIALKARLAKKKERPQKIKAVIDHKVHSTGKPGKSKKLYNAHAIKGTWLGAGYSNFFVLCFFYCLNNYDKSVSIPLSSITNLNMKFQSMKVYLLVIR
jgi:hypothetical protein